MAGYIGSKAVSVNTTSATISDDLTVGDDATIAGDLDVDGTTNLDVVDIDGAVDMASTLTVAGTLKIVDTELAEASDNFSINIQAGNNDFLVKSGGTTFASFKGFDGSKNFGTFSNGSGGFNLFVGSANTGSFALRLDGVGTSASNVVQFVNGNGGVGTITVSGSATAYNTSSDYRLKENVDYDWDATTRLKQLKPARFNFIADDTNTLVDGFLAHEAQAVIPEAVTGTKDAVDDDGAAVMQGIDQSKLVPLLVKTILELEARITALEG